MPESIRMDCYFTVGGDVFVGDPDDEDAPLVKIQFFNEFKEWTSAKSKAKILSQVSRMVNDIVKREDDMMSEKVWFDIGEDGTVFKVVESRFERRREAIGEAIDEIVEDVDKCAKAIERNEDQLGILLSVYEAANKKPHPLITGIN